MAVATGVGGCVAVGVFTTVGWDVENFRSGISIDGNWIVPGPAAQTAHQLTGGQEKQREDFMDRSAHDFMTPMAQE